MFDPYLNQLGVDNDKWHLSKHRAPSNSEPGKGKGFHSYILQPWHGSKYRSSRKPCYSKNTSSVQEN